MDYKPRMFGTKVDLTDKRMLLLADSHNRKCESASLFIMV